MMPTDWRNRRVKPGPSKPTTLRIKADKLDRLTAIADKHNTYKTTLIDDAIEKWLEAYDAEHPPKRAAKTSALFD